MEKFSRIFRLVDKYYVKQIKRFNLVNCRALTRRVSWTSCKSYGPAFLIETVHLLSKKIYPFATKKPHSLTLSTPSVT